MIVRKIKGLVRKIDNSLMKRLRRRRYIVFNGSCAMNFINFQPIYDRLVQDENVVVYVMNSANDDNFYTQFGIPSEQFLSQKAAVWKKWDLYVATDFYHVRFKRKLKSIFISHGVSQKKNFDNDKAFLSGNKLLKFDKIFFSSQQLYDDFLFELETEASRRAVLCGYPRLDYLVQTSADKTDVRRELGINDQRPIIMFAPTWGEYAALNAFGEEIIQALSELDAHIILKFHDHAFSDKAVRKNRVDWAQQLEAYKNVSNVYVIRDRDSYPYMKASDLMVADYGSIVLEYQLLNKPIVFFSIEKHNNSVVSNKALLSLLERACVTISQPSDLKSAVKTGLEKPEHARNHFKTELCEQYFLNVGQATAIAVDNINLLLEEV